MIAAIKLLWKQWSCKHEPKFVRNIHGDQIELYGYNRSLWRCSKCGFELLRPELH